MSTDNSIKTQWNEFVEQLKKDFGERHSVIHEKHKNLVEPKEFNLENIEPDDDMCEVFFQAIAEDNN
jgi:hypothetical protein